MTLLLIILLLLVIVAAIAYVKYRHKFFLLDYFMLNRPSVFLAFIVLFIACIVLGIIICGIFLGDEDQARLISIFVQSNITESDYSHFIFRTLVSVIGAVFFSGILVALLTNIVMRRSAQQASGTLCYNLKQHYLVFGSNSLLESIASDIEKYIEFDKHKKYLGKWGNRWLNNIFVPQVVVVTTHAPADIHRRLCNYKNIRRSLIIYSRDLNSNEILKNLNIERAKNVFIIGDDEPQKSDLTNIQILNEINKIKRNKRATPLPCYFSYSQERFVYNKAYTSNDDSSDDRLSLKLYPINHTHTALSNLWGWGAFARPFNRGRFYLYKEGKIEKFLLGNIIRTKNQSIVITEMNDVAEEVIKFVCLYAGCMKKTVSVNLHIITDDELAFERMRHTYNIDKIDNVALHRIADNPISSIARLQQNGQQQPFFVITSTDHNATNKWIDYLTNNPATSKSPVLAYSEKEYDDLNSIGQQQVEYFGFKDQRTLIRLGSEIYAHAANLYTSSNPTRSGNHSAFYRLQPAAQRPWIILVNFLHEITTKNNIGFIGNREGMKMMTEEDFKRDRGLAVMIENLIDTAQTMYQNATKRDGEELRMYKEIKQNYARILSEYQYCSRPPKAKSASADSDMNDNPPKMIFVRKKQ